MLYFMYIQVKNYNADMVEHLVTYSTVKMIVLVYIFVSPL